MSNEQFSNNAITTLGSTLGASGTTLTVSTGAGVLFPNPTGTQYFFLTLYQANSTTETPNEIVKVTARSGDSMTIVRAQQSTTAQNWNVGDNVGNFVTSGTLANFSQAVDTQQQAGNYAADAGTLNAGAVTLSPVPPSLAYLTGAPISVKKTSAANSGPYTLNVNGLGATPIVYPSGLAFLGGELPANGIFSVMYDGANFQLQSSGNNFRTRLTANTTFFVSTTGNDSNNGLTSGTPWLTIGHAINVLQDNYDLNGFAATIQLADGTYVGSWAVNGTLVGQIGSLFIQGNAGSPANVLLNTTSTAGGSTVLAGGGATMSVSGVKLQSVATSAACGLLQAGAGSTLTYTNVVFGATAAAWHVSAVDGGTVVCIGNYTISGSALGHFLQYNGGSININATSVATLTGTPAFSQAFCYAQHCGVFNDSAGLLSFSGAATGPRFVTSTNGVIDTDGGGANFFPGSSVGVQTLGGQYV